MPDINYGFVQEEQDVRLRRLGPATITALCGDRVEVNAEGRTVLATLAVPGTYVPVAGDVVLVIEAATAYVIGVLQASGPMVLRAPGDLVLAAPDGRITLQASEITGTAQELNLAADAMSLTAETFSGRFTSWRQAVAGAFELDAQAVAMRVKETFALLTGRLRAAADEDVSIDGKQIHLG